jgi:hypothetical protein
MYIMNRAYRAQGEERAATLDHLVALAKKERWAVRELEVIAALDDPLGWPGFTEPAVYALGRYFEEGTFSDNSHARTVISTCLAGPYELARYERLRPLCDGIASFIARLPEGSGDGVCFAAWTALSNAPVEALTGPLASWVAVCEERLAKLPLGNPERGVLQAMRADQVQKFGAPVPAFLGLASRLGWRDAATGAGLRVLGEEAGTGR